eukprot:Gb_38898 [translate_table: standard]
MDVASTNATLQQRIPSRIRTRLLNWQTIQNNSISEKWRVGRTEGLVVLKLVLADEQDDYRDHKGKNAGHMGFSISDISATSSSGCRCFGLLHSSHGEGVYLYKCDNVCLWV